MVQSEFTTIILKADEGMVLTQVGDTSLSERILASEIALGRYDSADNYKEITETEAMEIRELQKLERESKRRSLTP